jgi:hypothetical protein
MAGALSYIHVVIPINISGLLQAIHDFRSKVVTLKTKYTNKVKYWINTAVLTPTTLQSTSSFTSVDNFPGSWI